MDDWESDFETTELNYLAKGNTYKVVSTISTNPQVSPCINCGTRGGKTDRKGVPLRMRGFCFRCREKMKKENSKFLSMDYTSFLSDNPTAQEVNELISSIRQSFRIKKKKPKTVDEYVKAWKARRARRKNEQPSRN